MLAFSAKPDFSGTWKLNLAKSDLGPMPPPKAMTLKIEHQDPDLKVTTMISGGPQGDLNYDAIYTTDGKESINKLSGNQAHSTVTWDFDALVLQTRADFGGGEVQIRSRWVLSNSGKVLKQSAQVTTPQANFTTTYVFDKETRR